MHALVYRAEVKVVKVQKLLHQEFCLFFNCDLQVFPLSDVKRISCYPRTQEVLEALLLHLPFKFLVLHLAVVCCQDWLIYFHFDYVSQFC